MKHKKEIILVLIGVILILAGAYLTSRISVKEKTEKKVEKEELKVNGEVINLKLYRVDKAFFLKIPDSFVGKEAMTDDMLNNYVSSIKEGLTGFTDVKMENYQKHDKNFIKLTATSTDEAAKYYDIRYFTLEDKLVTVEFYTTINQKSEWKKVSKKILDSICFNEEDSKDITN